MNPTGRNIASSKNWKGLKSPWIGTKNIWDLFVELDLLDKTNIKDYTTLKIKSYWDSNVENYFAISSPDDDMLPVLSKGDLAIVHIQDTIEDKQTALIYFKDKKVYTIKKVVETKAGIELHSMNPTVKEIPINNINNIKIIGRVIRASVESAFE